MDPRDAVLGEARRRAQAGDPQGALRALDAAPKEERGGAWHYARGAMAVRMGQLDEAVVLLEEAVRLEPELAEYRSNLGAALLEKLKAGDQAAGGRALEELELAVQWGATLPEVYANLSFARLANGDAQGALLASDEAVRLEPHHVAALYNRAAALNALGRLGPCLEALNGLLKVAPEFGPAIQSRANTLAKLERASANLPVE